MEAPLLAVNGLNKTYITARGEIGAVDDVSFALREGEFVSLVGPSGCGKTTILRVVGGLVEPTSGEVSLQSRPLRGPQRSIGIVFQNATLLPWRTVLQNVMLPGEVFGLPANESRAKALDLLELVGLAGFEFRFPNELSGGMQQRVAIARALVYDPSILLMDEPFGALDAITREQMNVELMRIWSEHRKTILLVTHSIQEAVFLSNRVLVMTPRPGRIIRDVSVQIPRPRDWQVTGSEWFATICFNIRMLIEEGSR